MTESHDDKQESGQLPEEAPSEQVVDEGQGGSREEARDNPGAKGDEGGESTGNPKNAG